MKYRLKPSGTRRSGLPQGARLVMKLYVPKIVPLKVAQEYTKIAMVKPKVRAICITLASGNVQLTGASVISQPFVCKLQAPYDPSWYTRIQRVEPQNVKV